MLLNSVRPGKWELGSSRSDMVAILQFGFDLTFVKIKDKAWRKLPATYWGGTRKWPLFPASASTEPVNHVQVFYTQKIWKAVAIAAHRNSLRILSEIKAEEFRKMWQNNARRYYYREKTTISKMVAKTFKQLDLLEIIETMTSNSIEKLKSFIQGIHVEVFSRVVKMNLIETCRQLHFFRAHTFYTHSQFIVKEIVSSIKYDIMFFHVMSKSTERAKFLLRREHRYVDYVM